MIKLYDYLMSLISKCSNIDSIIVKSNNFYYQYDNVYNLLDRFHLMPEVKEFYKDYKVKDARISYNTYGDKTHRNIYINVEL